MRAKADASRRRALLKYYLLASGIVLAIAVAAGAYANRDLIRIKIASVYVRVSPKPAPGSGPVSGASNAFVGDAPWALSALPECFVQQLKATAPALAYVLRRVPADVREIRPPARLRFDDCALDFSNDGLEIRRGPDRLRVPGALHLYVNRSKTTLALLRRSGAGYELRTYDVVR